MKFMCAKCKPRYTLLQIHASRTWGVQNLTTCTLAAAALQKKFASPQRGVATFHGSLRNPIKNQTFGALA